MRQEKLHLLSKPETVDVMCNPLVALWIKEKARRDPLAFCRLAQDNRERFRRLYGPGARGPGSGEEMAWAVEELGIPLFLTSAQAGSCYRIHYPGGERSFAADRKMGSAITAFLERLLCELSGFGSKN